MHRIGKEPVRRFGRIGRQPRCLAAALARRQRRAPRAEARQPAQLAGAIQPRDTNGTRGAADQRFVGSEKER
jgi:hypothetical protein